MRRLYEFRRLRSAFVKVLTTMLLLMAALGAVYVILMSTGSMTAFSYALIALPTSVRNFFDIVTALDLSDPLAWFCRAMYIPMVVSSILWLAQGARTLNAEQESGLAELLFTQSGSRTALFRRRYCGGVLAILTNLAILGGLTSLFFRLVLGTTDPSYYTAIWMVYGRMIAVHFFCWNLGILFSAICASPVRACWCALGVFLGLTLTALIPASFGVLNIAWCWSFIHYAIPEYALHLGLTYTLSQIVAMCILFPATAIPAWLLLRTKEIDCEV